MQVAQMILGYLPRSKLNSAAGVILGSSYAIIFIFHSPNNHENHKVLDVAIE